MWSYPRYIMVLGLRLCDLMGMTAWFLLAAAMESHWIEQVSFRYFLSTRIKIQNFVIFFGLLLAWHLIFRTFALYESKRLSSRIEEVVDVIKAMIVTTLMVAATGQVFRITMITPLFLFIFWGGSAATMIMGRVTMRVMLSAIRKRGRNLSNIVIVGMNDRAVGFVRKLRRRPELGYNVVGFFDHEGRKETEAFKRWKGELLGDLSSFQEYLRRHVVDEVAIFLPMQSFYRESFRLIAACEEHGIIVRVPIQPFDLGMGKAQIEPLESDPLLTIYTGAMRGPSLLTKRLMDVALSAVLLVLLMPLFVVAGIAVKLSSPGTVFFVQERVGLNKRRFRLYKFRTMVEGAEKLLAQVEHLNEMSGPVFKIREDPRVNRVGRILRKTSVDELPQLFNVLKGDMSLVGPRPMSIRDFNLFDEDWHRRRFSVRPGVTCLWQVCGRTSIPFDKWMELDMQYIDQWSLWLDLKILFRTVPAVLKGSGAA